MVRHLITLLFISLFSIYAHSQINEKLRANYWQYGTNAALHFATCTPIPTSISSSQLVSFEGSASISDLNGNLLFYTNGEKVWDSNNNLMPNGTGLLGSTSTVQSSIIIPKPGNANWYYIFTAGTSIEDTGMVGVRFSEVDMTLNGGFGDVISATKNTLLFIPNEEKLTAVRNATSTGYWVAAQEYSSNKWYTYEVTSTGVSAPVISITGPNARLNNSLGAKFSPDGSMLVTQNGCAGGGPPPVPNWNPALTLYSFDNSTGQITYLWEDCGTIGWNLEFSPDNTKLYAAGVFLNQYDLTAGTGISDSTAIIASRTQISSTAWEIDALQLASDCKIYISQKNVTTNIGIIQNPNLAGVSCGYTTNYMTLTTGNGSKRFPNFVQSFFEFPCAAYFTFQDTCFNDTTSFLAASCNTIDSVVWNFDDPAGLPSNSSTSTTPNHIFSAAGSYNIQLIAYIGGTPDTTTTVVIPI